MNERVKLKNNKLKNPPELISTEDMGISDSITLLKMYQLKYKC